MPYRQTNIGVRPDLAQLEVAWPIGFIGRFLAPPVASAETSGTFSFQSVVADAAPQEDVGWNTARTVVQIAPATASYTCARQEKVYGLTEDDVRQLGGMDAADRAGAIAAKRSVQRKFEGDVYSAIFTSARRSAAPELASGLELQIIGAVAEEVTRVRGRLTLACSHKWFLAFCGLESVATRLQSAGAIGGVVAAQQALGVVPDVVSAMLRTVLPFEQILVGDSSIWGAYPEYAAIVMAPDLSAGNAILSAKLDPIYAVTMWYRPDPSADVELHADWEPNPPLNLYRAVAHYDVVELNSTGAALVKLPSSAIWTTTSSTTTTSSG